MYIKIDRTYSYFDYPARPWRGTFPCYQELYSIIEGRIGGLFSTCKELASDAGQILLPRP